MDCEKMEQLIALYVEGDASASESAQVDQHLIGCEMCRQFCDELRDCQQALKFSTRTAEEFDEIVLRQMRNAVMAEISHKPISLWQRFFSFFDWRFATATACLLTLGLTGYLYLRSVDEPLNAAIDMTAPVNLPMPKADLLNQQQTTTKNLSTNLTDNSLVTKRVSYKRGVTNRTKRDSSLSNRPILPNFEQATIPAEKMKIEIHTADPNVRIIWFVNKSSDKNTNS